MAKFYFVLLAILLSVVPNAAAKDTYYIGFLGNTNNANSNVLFNTLQLASDDFNSTNTAYTVTPEFFNETDPSVADSIKNKGNLLAVIGVFNADNKSILENVQEVPLISVASEFDGLNEAKRANVFRIAASDRDLAAATARFLISVSQKNRFAIVYSLESDEYKNMGYAFQAAAEKNRGRADYFKEADPDRKDFEAILLRLRDIKVKNIYFAGPAWQAALLAKQSSEMNVGADFSSTNRICTSAFIKTSKAGGQGAVFASIAPSSLYGVKKARPFMKRYLAKYQGDDMHMPYVMDAAGMVFSALAAEKKSKSDLVAYLHSQTYDGVTGGISFNEKGDRPGAPVYFYIIRGKEFLQRNLRGAEASAYARMK